MLHGPPAEPPPVNAPNSDITDAEPTCEEVKAAVKMLKSRKATGRDMVTAEALKVGGESLLQWLLTLLHLIWHTENIPKTW